MTATNDAGFPGLTRRRAVLPVLVLVMAFLGPALVPGSATAQGDPEAQARELVERNEDLLIEAEALVNESGSSVARRILDQAFSLQDRSRNLLDGGRFILAIQTARRTRAAIDHAVLLSRDDHLFRERYLILDERLAEQRSILEEKAEDTDDRMVLDFLDRADKQHARAEDILNQGDARFAFRLLEQVEGFQNRASRMLGDPWGSDRLEREMDRIDALIDQTLETLAESDEDGRQLLDEARAVLDRARAFAAEGRPGRAMLAAMLAQRLASRAADQPDDGVDPGTVARLIERWDERAAALDDQSAAGTGANPNSILLQSRRHRLRAEELLDRGDVEPALQQIKVAHDLFDAVEE